MEAVNRAAGLTDIGRRVFCPLTYAQAILNHCFGHKNDQWWHEYDLGWLPHCDDLVILMLPAWAESEGVRIESETAKELCIPISWGRARSCVASYQSESELIPLP